MEGLLVELLMESRALGLLDEGEVFSHICQPRGLLPDFAGPVAGLCPRTTPRRAGIGATYQRGVFEKVRVDRF